MTHRRDLDRARFCRGEGVGRRIGATRQWLKPRRNNPTKNKAEGILANTSRLERTGLTHLRLEKYYVAALRPVDEKDMQGLKCASWVKYIIELSRGTREARLAEHAQFDR